MPRLPPPPFPPLSQPGPSGPFKCYSLSTHLPFRFPVHHLHWSCLSLSPLCTAPSSHWQDRIVCGAPDRRSPLLPYAPDSLLPPFPLHPGPGLQDPVNNTFRFGSLSTAYTGPVIHCPPLCPFRPSSILQTSVDPGLLITSAFYSPPPPPPPPCPQLPPLPPST